MARLVWSILCRQAIRDSFTNGVSLLNIMEGIRLGEDPLSNDVPENTSIAIQFEGAVVCLWERSSLEKPESGEARLVYCAPNGTKYFKRQTVRFDLTGSHVRARTFGMIEALPYTGPGRYEFHVEWRNQAPQDKKWKSVAKLPLDISIATNHSEEHESESSDSTTT